ncbi:MAG: HPr family phosphocarrier protein [Legionellales bacterium]|nr:HPr family phosphocarrier protein [Legionellales bacterium]
MQVQTITIVNKLGLHARASAKLVNTASRFGAHIDIKRGNKIVNGKSIMGVMMLAASKGTEIELHIHGEDEVNAMQALVELITNRFGEDE